MHTVPIVFAFDENFKLPGYIAVKSLLDYAATDTFYDIFIMHDGLKTKTMADFNKLNNARCKINWIYVSKDELKDAPQSLGWNHMVYYRMLIPWCIPQYDKIIWSDVDVLFQKDMAEVYNMDLKDAYWAGVRASKNEQGMEIHTYFSENKNSHIYMSGFMVINAQKMRQDNMKEKFFATIKKYAKQLKLFDLEVLNIACGKILPIDFSYCVLENLYDEKDITKAKEYSRLSTAHTHRELQSAKDSPAIIHYAGKHPKIWDRSRPTANYLEYIKASPYYAKYKFFMLIKPFVKPLIAIIPHSKTRKRLRKYFKIK